MKIKKYYIENAIRFSFILTLLSVLFYWGKGGFNSFFNPSLEGLILNLMLGVFIFIMLVINCLASFLSLERDSYKDKIDGINNFTILTVLTFPVIIYVIKLTMENKSIFDILQ